MLEDEIKQFIDSTTNHTRWVCHTIALHIKQTTFFLKDLKELDECLIALHTFGEHSGLQLNISKCEGLWIGRSKYRQSSSDVDNIKWPTSPIKCLGIFIGHDTEECVKLNWFTKIDKLNNLLETWKSRRNLTLFGKVQVIRCLAMSGLIFTVTNCEIPSEDIISKINKILYSFLWGKSEKIKRNVLMNKKVSGGINMIDVKSQFEALKATWVPRIVNSISVDKKSLWTELPVRYLNTLGSGLYILEASIQKMSKCDLLSSIPKFYQEVILAHAKSKTFTFEDFTDNILHQNIFGNRFITYHQHSQLIVPYFVNWINSGIRYIGNLKITDGHIDQEYLYQKIKEKQNIHSEIKIMIKCLKSITRNLTKNPDSYDICDLKLNSKTIKAKVFYERLVSQVLRNGNAEIKWQQYFQTEIDFKSVYKRKIVEIKDNKIAETNFKILHNILPCGKNLLQWKKKEHDKCEVCNMTESIGHLIFECSYVLPIWSKVEATINKKLSLADIILGTSLSCNNNMIVSIIVYLIYKEWINTSMNNVKRPPSISMNRYANELEYYKRICCESKTLLPYVNTIDALIHTCLI